MFIADFHIHSHYSMATSKHSNPAGLYLWARKKGINLVGTGDISHPKWRAELKENLKESSPGIYTLKDKFKKSINQELPSIQKDKPMYYILTGEISSIYKWKGKCRKIHNLVFFENFRQADKFASELEKRNCNISSDGRPIIGLSAYQLLEIFLNITKNGIFIPAHIWTPYFSLFGSQSGFDSIEECFGDLSPHIKAIETGLSSDPPMNWRLKALDNISLISNSDAHSPEKLGREANLFDTKLTFNNIRSSLFQKDSGFKGTLEFFPEEGKYHFDGHRKCRQVLSPTEANKIDNLCPVCGKKMTIGVSHRVEDLADRDENEKPAKAKPFESLVPLKEIIADALGIRSAAKKVSLIYEDLISNFNSEFTVLREAKINELEKTCGDLIAEGIRRVRNGEVKPIPGYDGEFGIIKIFDENEKAN